MKGTRHVPADERRRLILRAALRIVPVSPYRRLSMTALAREVGISRARLYHLFPTHADLREALGR